MAEEIENVGLRARKKARTRAAIREAALALFAERGFERVKVADVADRADVSEATVYNYFATKEDLVYGELETFRAAMLQAVRERGTGVSAAQAYRDFLLGQRAPAGTGEELARLVTITRIITTSPALLARERLVDDASTAALAAEIAVERRAAATDVRPWVAAHALVGAHRALIAFLRQQVLAGVGGPLLRRRVRAQTVKAFALLDEGLAGYL
jgi:AcrR family transcriptional regulator